MSNGAIFQLACIAAFVVISWWILALFKHNKQLAATPDAAGPKTSGLPADSAQVRAFDKELDQVLQTYDRAVSHAPSPETKEARFREQAKARLEPLLENIVRSSVAHGAKASYGLRLDSGEATYRLEIRRDDHPEGEPLPFISLSRGAEGDVAVEYGGSFPNSSDRDFKKTEIDWHDAAWVDIADELLKFTKAVFKIVKD